MKILILTPEYLPNSGGGIVTFYRWLLPQFVAAGHHVHLIQGSGVFAEPGPSPLGIDGVETETLESERLFRHLARFSFLTGMPGLQRHLAAAWAMWEQVEQGADADVIEACDWGLSFIPAILWGHKPVVIQAHGSIGQIDIYDPIAGDEAQGVLVRLIEAIGMQRASAVQTSSRSNAEFWALQTGRVVDRILPAWRRTASGPRPHTDSGLVVGRVQDWKGPHILCEALTHLGDKAPRIDWVGRDTDFRERGRSTSEMLAAEFPAIWGRQIRHFPQVASEEVAQLQRAAAFVMVPSTWDVFNIACVEAMASGRPVICSTGAGASELIEEGVNGFVFQNGNAAELADAIARVLALDETQRSRLGAAAQDKVASELDPERIAAVRLRRYADAIQSFTPRPAAEDDWLRNACSGRDGSSPEMAFLDHLPLKPLITYGARRLSQKMLGLKR